MLILAMLVLSLSLSLPPTRMCTKVLVAAMIDNPQLMQCLGVTSERVLNNLLTAYTLTCTSSGREAAAYAVEDAMTRSAKLA